MVIIIGKKQFNSLVSDLEKRLAGLEKELKECKETNEALTTANEWLSAKILELEQKINKTEEISENPIDKVGKETLLRKGFFDLNRSSVFVELKAESNAKSAFAAFPYQEENCVCYEICNLGRIKAFDGILDAVEFEQGSCTLSEAKKFKTISQGIARFGNDHLWRIEKKTLVLLSV